MNDNQSKNESRAAKSQNLSVGKDLSDFLLRGNGKPSGFALWTGLISVGIAWWAPDTYSTLGKGSGRGWLVFSLILLGWAIFWAGVQQGMSGKDVSVIAVLAPVFVIWLAFYADAVRIYMRIKTQAAEMENRVPNTATDKALHALALLRVRGESKKAKEMLSKIDWTEVNPEIRKKFGV